jgi:iron complex transport system substrate-binding protein
MMRVVSLLASGTEIVCALGEERRLVGRSHECDYPESIQALPQVTSPKHPFDGTSYEIHAQVQAVLNEGLSVYRVDSDKLKSLAPDLLVTQTQCEVCAVSPADLSATCGAWLGHDTPIVNLAPYKLSDIWADIQRVADGLGIPDRGRALIAELRGRMDAVVAKTRALPHPRTAVIEWIEPIFTGGNWMPELVTIAGGTPLLGTPGVHSPVCTPTALAAAAPEVLVVTPCGFGLARTAAEFPVLTRIAGWAELPAVREGRVYLADGNAYFNRSGPRIVESAEILAEILHPRECEFGHEGKDFVRVRGE